MGVTNVLAKRQAMCVVITAIQVENVSTSQNYAVVSDLTDQPNPSFTADSTWTVVEGISLTMEDKMILASNKWLSDSHVSAAQFLLKKQHPNISGFEPPTLQYTRTFSVHKGKDFIQCLHVLSNHWILISSVGCPANVILVYDSMNTRLSTSNKAIVADLLQSEHHITIKYVKTQYQKGYSDCGLFAIANAVAICNGLSPEYLKYDQN